MSVEMKPGRWQERGGGVAEVYRRDDQRILCPWVGNRSSGASTNWTDDGSWSTFGIKLPHDLVEYLGPLEEKT